MTANPILARGELEVIWLLVMVLIGIVTWVRGILQRRAAMQKAQEKGGEPPPPVSTQVRKEILKYLGELPEKKEEEPAPEPKPMPVPPPIPEPPPPPPIETIDTLDSLDALDLPPAEAWAPRPGGRRRRRRRPGERSGAGGRSKVLRTKNDLRRAILHREILGPPVSLRRSGRGASRLTRR
jgi:hypothetical protein